jgi:DNA polymerase III delta prime subunit
MQTVLFARFINKCAEEHIAASEIAEELNIKTIRLVQHLDDIDELVKRKLIVRRKDYREKTTYCVPADVLQAIRKGENYIPPAFTNLDIDDMFERLADMLEDIDWEETCQDALFTELENLVKENPHLVFSKTILEHELDQKDNAILLYFCHKIVNEDDELMMLHDLQKLFQKKTDAYRENDMFCIGAHSLMQSKIVGYHNDNGFGDRDTFCLTEETKKTLLAELGYKSKHRKSKHGLLLHTSFPAKTMFYNADEERHIKRLSELLTQDNFKNVLTRLAESGMRTGFPCLFYGAPGTGKTETVYQIARATGRDIMQVDIADTKSMWFGESEKKIKDVFEHYREYVKQNPIAPILLFNEADAVIGKRKDVTTGNVAQTENAIQNIILQELETLNGILIATTNLTQNLDNAFERRFLYKIEFKKPTRQAKQYIWQSMLPTLSDTDARELAERYDFSGGQIENVSRKHTVDKIIKGSEPDLTMLHEYCQTEALNKRSGQKMGF